MSQYRRSAFFMWFDYKKAFDSIPHEWLFTSLELARVPEALILAIQQLSNNWQTEITLQTEKDLFLSDFIKYLTGILQGDCLSLLLFILCINPLSFLLNKNSDGYIIGNSKQRDCKITHLLFVDDLKTFAKNKDIASKQLEIITEFTNDIGMTFGADKCAYINIDRGNQKSLGEQITINGLELNELKYGESYKYLGQDEDTSYKGELNKTRVTQEYYRRVKKIWKSELYSKNKIVAHNTFASPVLTPTFGILSWTKTEIESIDIKTRKIMTLTGSFHRNSSVDRLYSPRIEGGRGLNSVLDIFLSRIVSVTEHLRQQINTHPYLREVYRHEGGKLVRLSDEICRSFNIEKEDEPNPRKLSKNVRDTMNTAHSAAWQGKPQHGYVHRNQTSQPSYDKVLSNKWLTDNYMTSHVEGFLCAMQEQEIRTRLLDKQRNIGEGETKRKCRHCNAVDESIFHLLSSCGKLSASLYLPVRHNEVAKDVYNELTSNHQCTNYINKPEPIFVTGDTEIWWDRKIRVCPPVEHCKPDIVVWHLTKKLCTIIDICVPLDVNVEREENTKRDKYLVLASRLQRLYPEYMFKVVPIVLGATGFIPKSLITNLQECGFEKDKSISMIPNLQRKALRGSMKILKTSLKMK